MYSANPKRFALNLRACLNECYNSPEPLLSIAAFVDRLRQRQTWSEWELRRFEATVRRILRQILSDGHSELA
jgi:hypothetical protein